MTFMFFSTGRSRRKKSGDQAAQPVSRSPRRSRGSGSNAEASAPPKPPRPVHQSPPSTNVYAPPNGAPLSPPMTGLYPPQNGYGVSQSSINVSVQSSIPQRPYMNQGPVQQYRPPPPGGYGNPQPNWPPPSSQPSPYLQPSSQPSPYPTPSPQPSPYLPPSPQPYLQPYNPRPSTSNSTTNLPYSSHPQSPKSSKWKSPFKTINSSLNRASQSVNNLSTTLSTQTNATSTRINQIASKPSIYLDESTAKLNGMSTVMLAQGAALCDRLVERLDQVITEMDGETWGGDERDLVVEDSQGASMSSTREVTGESSRALNTVVLTSAGMNHFRKVWLYANSRLPPHMPPFKVYLPTHPLLTLAARYSLLVYSPPSPAETHTHVPASISLGTKAMLLKSLPLDTHRTIIFAIRGSQSFTDWAVNFRPAPTSPEGFLDDPGNLCHAGFLHVARQMVAPVAARLRELLQQNPDRGNMSLLITGHSAGGAVASLLYAHMYSTTPQASSELNHLTGFFKRVHCITFGAPPLSLLPIQRTEAARKRKSCFFAFANEGDPVVRADRRIVGSLLKLWASPAPDVLGGKLSMLDLSVPGLPSGRKKQKKNKHKPANSNGNGSGNSGGNGKRTPPIWPIPDSILSLAGRVVVLRNRPGTVGEQNVEAVGASDEMLRGVVYGDPMMHMMSLYKSRVEGLAVRAVVGEN